MISSDYIIWIFLAGYISHILVNALINFSSERSKNSKSKLVTRNIFIDKYDDFQKFHINEFKKIINSNLQAYMEVGQKLPIQITYRNVFSESSLSELKNYIEQELKFTDFELEQRDDIGLRLILK